MARRAAVIGPPTTVKLLGALPVVAVFCSRLDIAGIIDRACPIRDLATLSHGQVIEVLIANRLTSPRPLVHVADWARTWAVSEVFGADPEALNDDRIGRALDALAPVLDQVVGSIGAQRDRSVRDRGVTAALGHGIDQPVRSLPRGRRGVRRAALRAPEGPQTGPQADPDRARGHQ
jgi:Domain of unknown function (DUF4277)